MKQGLNFALRVKLNGIEVEDIAAVEFCFRKAPNPSAPLVKEARYPDNVTYADGSFIVHWIPEETYRLKSGEDFWMDTRITLSDTAYQPETNMVKLTMNPTLFEEE